MVSNNIQAFPLVGKPAGVPLTQATAVTDTRHNQDHEALSDFPFRRNIRGVNCTDKASDAVHCEIWLEPVGGVREVADANCYAKVNYNGTHIWTAQVQIFGGETFISFADANCDTHTVPGIANYALPAFIDALYIEITAYPDGEVLTTASEVLLNPAAPDGLHAGLLMRQVAGVPPVGSVEEGLVDVETGFAAAHDPVTGDHLAGVIAEANINEAALALESYENLIVGGRVEEDDDGDGRANGWTDYGAPTSVVMDAVNFKCGIRSMQIITPGPGIGVQTAYDARVYAFSDFAGEDISASVWVLATVNGTVIAELFDGVGATASAGLGVAGTWVRIPVRRTFAAGANTLVLRVYSNVATTFNVDDAMVTFGRKLKRYTASPAIITHRLMTPANFVNWLPNGDYYDWTRPAIGAVRLPDFWTAGNPPTQPPAAGPTVSARDAVNFARGIYGHALTLNGGEMLYIATVNPADLDGLDGYISLSHFGVGAPGALQAFFDDTVVGIIQPLTTVVGVWNRLIFPVSIDAASAAQYLTLYNPGAFPIQFVIDTVSLTEGLVPEGYKPATAFMPIQKDFVKPGAPAAAVMFHEGAQLDCFPVPWACWIHRMLVKSLVAPGGAVVDTYTLQQNGAPTALVATVTGAATTGANHLPALVPFAQGDLIQVVMTPGGGTAAQNTGVVVDGFRIGY